MYTKGNRIDTRKRSPKRKRRKSKPKPKDYWTIRDNRRDYFVQFAESMKFDPTKAENWKNVTLKQLVAKQVSLPFIYSIHLLFILNLVGMGTSATLSWMALDGSSQGYFPWFRHTDFAYVGFSFHPP